MPSLSRLSAGLQYRSAMRGQMVGTRMFTATRMDREEDGHETYTNEPDIKRASKEIVSWERFYQLDKDVGILNVKMDTVQESVKGVKADIKELKQMLRNVEADVKEVARKVDRLLYFIIGGVLLTGGMDLFRDERNKKRLQGN